MTPVSFSSCFMAIGLVLLVIGWVESEAIRKYEMRRIESLSLLSSSQRVQVVVTAYDKVNWRFVVQLTVITLIAFGLVVSHELQLLKCPALFFVLVIGHIALLVRDVRYRCSVSVAINSLSENERDLCWKRFENGQFGP